MPKKFQRPLNVYLFQISCVLIMYMDILWTFLLQHDWYTSTGTVVLGYRMLYCTRVCVCVCISELHQLRDQLNSNCLPSTGSTYYTYLDTGVTYMQETQRLYAYRHQQMCRHCLKEERHKSFSWQRSVNILTLLMK